MPNWVYNRLSIEAQDVTPIAEQVARPYEKRVRTFVQGEGYIEKTEAVNAPFSFWNIIKPSDDILEEYYAIEADPTKDNGWFGKSDPTNLSQHWYDWNLRNWGTKWDVYHSAEPFHEDNGLVCYTFETAWSPPEEAIAKLSEQYPDATLILEYEEEQGWGGRIRLEAGKITVEDTWDIPDSHQDYLDRDNECICQWETDSQWWYDDCPKVESKV
jgi:hypothetical protein